MLGNGLTYVVVHVKISTKRRHDLNIGREDNYAVFVNVVLEDVLLRLFIKPMHLLTRHGHL